MGLEEPKIAMAMRDVMERLVRTVVDRERPRYRYAEVVSIDDANNKCDVTFPGESTVVTVTLGTIRPNEVGQVVRVAGIGSDKYVEDVVGGVPVGGGGGVAIGDSMWWTGPAETIPEGFMEQDGRQLAIATYPTVYNKLTNGGTIFIHGANTNGAGAAGTTHFRLPNMKGLVPVHRDATQTEFDILGETGGVKSVTLTGNQSGIQPHTHGIRGGTNAVAGGAGDRFARSTAGDDPGFRTTGVAAHDSNYNSQTYPTGKDALESHTNLQPYRVGLWIIKVSSGEVESPEMVTTYPAKRYSMFDPSNDTTWNSGWPAAWTIVPGMTLVIPVTGYDRTVYLDSTVIHTGTHCNYFAIFANGAQLTDSSVSEQAGGTAVAFKWTIAGIKINIPANTTLTIDVRSVWAYASGGSEIRERSIVADVFPGAGSEHIIGSTTVVQNNVADQDTGLRDITSLATSTFKSAVPASRMYLRRIGKRVTIQISINESTAGGQLSCFSSTSGWPSGFKIPDHRFFIGATEYRRGVGSFFSNTDGKMYGGSQLQYTVSSGHVEVSIYGIPASHLGNTTIEFNTDEPWPVALPGVAMP